MSASLQKLCFIGLLLGFTLSAVIVSRMETSGRAVSAVWAQYLLSGLYGAACMGGTVLYEIESWPLMKSTVIHWLITALLYAPIALVLGWVNSLSALLLMEGIMLAAFLLIWLFMHLRCKAQVRKLNELLKKNQAYSDNRG